MAEEELSDKEQRWIDKLINPLDGPASENAYPEDMTFEVDGKQVSMNQSARRYNRAMGYVDKAADKPWKGPKEVERPIQLSDEQLAEHAALQAKWDAEEARFEESKLKSNSQLPDLEGDDLKIIWDFEEHGEDEDSWTVLRHGDLVIWREIGTKEALPRFEEVIWILREKYGPRLTSLLPTRAGLLQIRGRFYTAKTRIDGLNQELRNKRQPLESRWSIDMEDSDTDLPDRERQEEKLMASAREMGTIDCSCGWAGEATDARIIGSGSSRDINCPDCRRPLYRMTLDE